MTLKAKEFALSHEQSFTGEEVLEQLDRILGYGSFHASPILCKFLRYIVEETLAGNADRLKEYTIGVHALGKGQDFNPQSDAVVRIHAGRLRRLLAEYYEGRGSDDSIEIQVLKGTYVPLIIPRGSSMQKSERVDPVRLKNRNAKLSLAVLPFRNLGEDSSFQFFADGFGEELTSLFSNFHDIVVVAHHSARKYGGLEHDLKTIGAKLGVDYLITGIVRRTQQEIRINVGLLETTGGIQVWAKSFRFLVGESEVFDIQDQIVLDIYGVLGGYYGLIVRDAALSLRSRKISSLKDFDAILWNYYFHMNFSEETFIETRKALEEALRQDPGYAKAMAILAELYIDGYTFGYPTVENALQVGYEMAKKAVKLDPECHHCQRSFAWANVYLKKKRETMLAMERCLELNPYSVSTTGTIGFGMACVGEYDRGMVLLQSAQCLNPHCPWWFFLGYFFIYFRAGAYGDALDAAEKITQQDVFFKPLTKAAAKGKLGLIEEAEDDIADLKINFGPILKDLRAHVGAILLDEGLVGEILEGVSLAGLVPHTVSRV